MQFLFGLSVILGVLMLKKTHQNVNSPDALWKHEMCLLWLYILATFKVNQDEYDLWEHILKAIL